MVQQNIQHYYHEYVLNNTFFSQILSHKLTVTISQIHREMENNQQPHLFFLGELYSNCSWTRLTTTLFISVGTLRMSEFPVLLTD